MEKMIGHLAFIFFLVLGGESFGVRALLLSDKNSDLNQEIMAGHEKPHQHLRLIETDDKFVSTTPPSAVKNDKLLGDANRPFKEFDVNDIFESFLKPFQTLFEPNKKPKVKTVVSLTEVVGPKHQIMQPFHQDPLTSQFGVKELGFMDDPFNFDFGRMLPGFMPKISKVDFIWPMKHNHDRHIDGTNVSELESPNARHRHIKRDMSLLPKLDCFDEKVRTGPSLFIKGAGEPPMVSLGEINLDEGGSNVDEAKEKMCSLVKALPYLEGAIGGVMFVMLVLVIASWRVRKPTGIWARVPFIDKTDYVEKV